MPRPERLRTLSLGGVAAALVLSAVTASASGSETAAKPRWYEVPNLEIGHGRALTGAGWANGRVWLVVGSAKKLTVVSARVRGSALASFQTTDIQAPGLWYPILLGSEVVYATTRTSSAAAALLSSGKVGPGEAPSPDPMAGEVGAPVAAVRLGGRTVWALAGGRAVGPSGFGYKPTLWACCDDSGTARNLTSLITARIQSPPRNHSLGIDRQGRIWLAWIDGPLGRAEVRIVQLDPATLAPLTRKALVAPVARPSGPSRNMEPLALACAATCRVVLGSVYSLPTGGVGRRIVTWAPGERSATTVDLGSGPDDPHPGVVGADYRGDRLAVAYSYWPSSGSGEVRLNVVVGDVLGRGGRLAGSVTVPAISRGRQPWFSAGTFVPSGYLHAQMYSKWGTRGHVVAGVLPLK